MNIMYYITCEGNIIVFNNMCHVCLSDCHFGWLQFSLDILLSALMAHYLL